MEKTKKAGQGSFVKSVFILSLGGFIAKLLGAFYRIPLTNIIGSYGMGIYQLVFPLFSLLLTVSTAGIPVAVSKLVAEKAADGRFGQAKGVFFMALALLALLGLAGSAALYFLAGDIAVMQGNADAADAYRLIAPSVLLVCVISAYRGYFQGLMRMAPTALSQIVEQTVKMTVGLVAAAVFIVYNIKRSKTDTGTSPYAWSAFAGYELGVIVILIITISLAVSDSSGLGVITGY